MSHGANEGNDMVCMYDDMLYWTWGKMRLRWTFKCCLPLSDETRRKSERVGGEDSILDHLIFLWTMSSKLYFVLGTKLHSKIFKLDIET